MNLGVSLAFMTAIIKEIVGTVPQTWKNNPKLLPTSLPILHFANILITRKIVRGPIVVEQFENRNVFKIVRLICL